MSKSVIGSATAETSPAERFDPHPVAEKPATSCCQSGAEKRMLQPPPLAPSTNSEELSTPLPFQTVSLARFSPVSLSVVPPTATTVDIEDGMFGAAGDGGAVSS